MPKRVNGQSIDMLREARRKLRAKPFLPCNEPELKDEASDILGNYWAGRATCEPRGEVTGGPSKYQVVIVFHNVQFTPKPTSKHQTAIEVAPGQYQFMDLPSLSKNPVKISCTCPDYYWTWNYYNFQKNVHSGVKMPDASEVTGSGKRLTDGKKYGSLAKNKKTGNYIARNYKKTPGICKHINAFADTLVKEKKAVK